MIIPGVPEGAGARELVVANPGPTEPRSASRCSGSKVPSLPIGAETLVVPPESTASVGLTGGLAGQSGSIRLTSTQPVTAAVHAVSSVQGARPDLAVQPAVAPLSRTGVVALASVEGVDAEFVLSNGGDRGGPALVRGAELRGSPVADRRRELDRRGHLQPADHLTGARLSRRPGPPDAAIFGSVELPLVHRERGGSGQCAGHLTGSGRSRAPGGVRPRRLGTTQPARLKAGDRTSEPRARSVSRRPAFLRDRSRRWTGR